MEAAAIQIAHRLRDTISSRVVASGGYAPLSGKAPRPDSTAWATLALASAGAPPDTLLPARHFLADCQMADGSVPLAPNQLLAWWPTALAILAWLGAKQFIQSQTKAVAFLLQHTGRHSKPGETRIFKHNPALKGWPWVGGSHSWVEPTAMSVISLRATGFAEHPRVAEAVRLLMDRKLNRGGWNYGNTEVFGAELKPMPDATGMALASLPGLFPPADLQNSLDYLASGLRKRLTPLSFAWSLLGLNAWNVPVSDVTMEIGEILARQARLGPYDTSELSQLLLALKARRGILDLAITLQRGDS